MHPFWSGSLCYLEYCENQIVIHLHCIYLKSLLLEHVFSLSLKIGLLKSTLKNFIATPECMARILNAKHFQRLSNYLQDVKVAASVVHGGSLNPKTL